MSFITDAIKTNKFMIISSLILKIFDAHFMKLSYKILIRIKFDWVFVRYVR